MKYKLRLIWRILTRDDWWVISATSPTYPFTLWIGSIEVIYHNPTPEPPE